MKNVTIISGGQCTGKTTVAHEIASGKKVFESDDSLKIAVASMPLDTEVIIIQMDFVGDILNAIKADYLLIRRPYSQNSIPVKVPDLIITTCISIDFIKQIQSTQIVELTQTIK